MLLWKESFKSCGILHLLKGTEGDATLDEEEEEEEVENTKDAVDN